MNIVILIGKVVDKIEYKFMYKSKNNAKITFKLLTRNNSIISVIAYDNIADKLYQTIELNNTICLYGRVNSKNQIEVKEFEKLKFTDIHVTNGTTMNENK